MDLNRQLFEFVFSFANHSPVLDAYGIFLAEYLPYFLVIGIFFFVFSLPSWRQRGAVLSFLAFVLILARGVIAQLIYFFLPVARPFVVLNFTPLVGNVPMAAFPSAHATIFFSLALALMCFNRSWGWSYFVAACLVGVGRVFAGVHWPFDILGGFLVAIISVGGSWLFLEEYIGKLLSSEQAR